MSERVVAIVPVRSLRHGKTRLSSVLGNEVREALLRGIAYRVIAAAVESGLIETVLVVSPDAQTLTWAAGMGPAVVSLPQPEHRLGLNGAIDAGRAWALDRGMRGADVTRRAPTLGFTTHWFDLVLLTMLISTCGRHCN